MIVIPYIEYGNNMVIEAVVNGKKCQMLFDTGSYSIAFPVGYLGIKIPADAQEMYSRGSGGVSRAWRFNIDQINEQLKVRREHMRSSLASAEHMIDEAIRQQFTRFQLRATSRNHLNKVESVG